MTINCAWAIIRTTTWKHAQNRWPFLLVRNKQAAKLCHLIGLIWYDAKKQCVDLVKVIIRHAYEYTYIDTYNIQHMHISVVRESLKVVMEDYILKEIEM